MTWKVIRQFTPPAQNTSSAWSGLWLLPLLPLLVLLLVLVCVAVAGCFYLLKS